MIVCHRPDPVSREGVWVVLVRIVENTRASRSVLAHRSKRIVSVTRLPLRAGQLSLLG